MHVEFPAPLMRAPLMARTLASLLLGAPAAAIACSGSVHVEVEHAGAYALDHATIVAQEPGLSDCASSDLVLTHLGEPVPIRISGDQDGRFAKGSRIEWVGEQLHGPLSWFNAFSVNNVYLLSASPGPHPRMREIAAAEPSPRARLERSLHLEQENLMIRLDQSQQKPGEETDVWHWAKLTHADPEPFKASFDLPDLDERGGGTSIRMNFRGMSSLHAPGGTQDKPSDHAVELWLNDKLVRTIQWDGRSEFSTDVQLPASGLKASGNEMRLSVPKRDLPWKKGQAIVDIVMFNWIELDYAVRGDLDASALPLKVASGGDAASLSMSSSAGVPVLYGNDGTWRPGKAGAAGSYVFAAPPAGTLVHPVRDGALASPVLVRRAGDTGTASSQGYDYLIVSHPTLIEAIRPLAEFHEKRGLKVALLDVQNVYDEFNHGIPHPQGIRNLVTHAHDTWELKPRFLLLVGDASFDIRNNTENDLRYAKFANNIHELAYSGHFAGIPGTSYGAEAPKFAGRNLIPTWQYPSPEGQSASDNPYGIVGEGYHPTVAVGRFPVVTPDEVAGIVEKTINYVSTPQLGNWRRDVMFITDESDYFKKASNDIADTIGAEGFVADRIYASASEGDNLAHQSAIKDGINEGQLLVHFLGHGGRYIWRTGPPDIRKNHDLFTLDDVSNLTNHGKLPMILSMTCYSAPFDNPSEDSIGERFLRERDKGAVAVFAASWRNAPSTNYSKALVGELLTPGATIGEGIVRAKKSITDRTLVEMYNLLGDPALVLERPRDRAQVVLDESRWSRGLLVSLPGNSFNGRIDIDWLDEEGTKIASSSHTSNEARFRVPMPTLAEGKQAHSVRVYAADLRSGRDASVGVKLDDLRHAHVDTRWAWLDWFKSEPAAEESTAADAAEPTAMMLYELPYVADRLSAGGFEHDRSNAKLVAGN